jgi:hypothetical protein
VEPALGLFVKPLVLSLTTGIIGYQPVGCRFEFLFWLISIGRRNAVSTFPCSLDFAVTGIGKPIEKLMT